MKITLTPNGELAKRMEKRISESPKQPVINWSIRSFNVLLYAICRYGNESLFMDLAALIKRDTKAIMAFIAATQERHPKEAAQILDRSLLNRLKVPKWKAEDFMRFFHDRILECTDEDMKKDGSNRYYGKTTAEAYLLHTATPSFQGFLAKSVDIGKCNQALYDWLDAYSVLKAAGKSTTGVEKILLLGFRTMDDVLKQLGDRKADVHADDNIQRGLTSILIKLENVIEYILRKEQHDLTHQQFLDNLQRLFELKIARQRYKPEYCETHAAVFFLIAGNLSVSGYDELPKEILVPAAHWAEQQRVTAQRTYGYVS